MTGAANGRQPNDPGAKPSERNRRKVWIEGKVTAGNLITMLLIVVTVTAMIIRMQANDDAHLKAITLNSKRIAALSAADTRRGNQIADKIVAAIADLRTAVEVLSTASTRFEAEVRRELDELRRDVRLQRGREGP